jgi:ornithine cyclodeaminase/alanine dehydrogenase-like protein (mu-crystallin family)
VAVDDAVLLGDDDVRRLPSTVAVDAARAALLAAYRGWLIGAPRVAVPAGDGELVFTVGGYGSGSGPVGFRVYGIGDDPVEQVTLVWNRSGRLAAVVAGGELGARRTGAIGAVAVDLLARSDAEVVGLVGAGVQAWTQLWALQAVRPLGAVRVFSRHAQGREAFAKRAREELAVSVRPVPTAQEAVTDADIVVLATRSQSPVIDPAWVNPGTHVTTVGPKTTSAHECPIEIPARATVVATDSPAQVAAYSDPCFAARELTHLGAIAAGDAPGRSTKDDITLFLSTGLAGSEVVLASSVLEAQRRDRS